MGLTDSAMVGHVGRVPLAASAFAGSVFGLFYVAGTGLLVPVSVLVARAHGAGQTDGCARWLRHGLAIGLAVSALEACAMLVLATQMHRLGQPPEVVAATNPFFAIIAVSLVPTFLFQVLRQFSEATGRPWQPMVILFLCVGLNAFLNWVLIFGHLGFPALGLTGSGISTLLAPPGQRGHHLGLAEVRPRLARTAAGAWGSHRHLPGGPARDASDRRPCGRPAAFRSRRVHDGRAFHGLARDGSRWRRTRSP